MYPKYPYPEVSVIICTLNEEKNLPYVLPRIPAWVDEIILVDGHSTDGTVEAARKIRSDINVLYQPNEGKGDALKYGISESKGDIIVALDGDGTYSPEEMCKFVQAILDGNDFAKGSRFMCGEPTCIPANRRFGNRVLAWSFNLLFRTHFSDVCSGYYAFRKEVFQKIGLISDGFDMEQELFVKIAKMRFKVAEVPHSYRRRSHGSSKTRDFRQGIRDLLWIVSFRFRA